MFRVIERSNTPDLFEGIMSGGARVNQRGGLTQPTQSTLPSTPGDPIEVITPSAPPMESTPTTPTTPFVPEIQTEYVAPPEPLVVSPEIFDKKPPPAREFFHSRSSNTNLEGGSSNLGTFFKLDWSGFSGLLQWFTKYPIPIESSWAFTLNQILWNALFFVLVYGLIYGAIINSGSEMLTVPEEIQKQTPSPWTQGIYFSVVTMTSLGFGDITPGTFGGQMLVTSQILFFFIFNFIWTLNFDFMEASN